MEAAKQHIEKALFKAIGQTIEEIAFLEVDRELDEASQRLLIENQIWARINIHAPFEGSLSLRFDRKLAAEMTETVYSAFEQPTNEQILDTFAELLNTIVGCFMSDLTPPEVMFEVGLPEQGFGQHPPVSPDALEVRYSINESEVVLALDRINWVELSNFKYREKK